MAITIQNTPGSYLSVHDDIIFTVVDIVKASTPLTYTDYRYICDIYVASTLVASLKSYPNPANKCGVFNVSNILRNYVAATFNPTAATVKAQEMGLDEFRIVATMKFGEEYGGTSYTNLTVDSARTYYNHYNGRLLGVVTNLSGIIDMPVSAQPSDTSLSTVAEKFPVFTNAVNHYVPYVHSTSSAYTIRVKSYSDADALLTTQDITVTPAAANNLISNNISPACINAAFANTINTAVASYYTVQFVTANIVLDRILKFKLVCEAKFTVHSIHFLNRYGGFETRQFTKVSRKVIDINRSEFGRLGYTMDSSGVVTYKNANNVYNEQRSVFHAGYKEKMVLNTDILSDNEYLWLADLILSPLVYIEQADVNGTIYFVPCVITGNDYEFRKRVNDTLTNLTINIEFGERYNSQFR